jgi:HEAT repeat protein
MTRRYHPVVAVTLFLFFRAGVSTDASSLEQNVERQNVQPPVVKQQAAGAPTEGEARLVTVAADGTVSLTAPRVLLRTVLTEISVQTRIPIILSDAFEDARLSVTVRDLPLEDAMKRLLADYDTFYLFGPRDKKAASIKAIWIYPKGEGETLQPLPPTVWASTNDLKAQMDDPDVAVRTQAIETLIERLGNKALPIVLRGLADGDEIVRLATLSAAADSGVEIPAADLHSRILTDPSAHVRIAALRAVDGRPEAQAIASGLRSDPDDDIRNQALAMLGELQRAQSKQRPK